MTISPEAVQAALDAYCAKQPDHVVDPYGGTQAALEAAFPIMLREVAEQMHAFGAHAQLNEIADSYGKDG